MLDLITLYHLGEKFDIPSLRSAVILKLGKLREVGWQENFISCCRAAFASTTKRDDELRVFMVELLMTDIGCFLKEEDERRDEFEQLLEDFPTIGVMLLNRVCFDCIKKE